jgi:hypothetical protein
MRLPVNATTATSDQTNFRIFSVSQVNVCRRCGKEKSGALYYRRHIAVTGRSVHLPKFE